jgi:exosortase
VGIFALWLPLWIALSVTWRVGIYYEYGWLVPPAVLLFAYWAWPQRPPTASASIRWPYVVGLLIALSALRLIEAVDVTWRMPLAVHALVASVATWWILVRAYDRASAKRMLPILVLACIAVPWPSIIEIRLINGFTALIAATTAETLLLLGEPVQQMGNTLMTVKGPVEVSEGCSGLRSFQSLVMAGLFFGQLYHLRFPQRVGLVVIATAVGLATNLVRAIALSLITINHGATVFDRWHDPIGNMAFIGAIVVTFAVGRWMERRAAIAPQPRAKSDPVKENSHSKPSHLWRNFAIVPITCILAAEAFTLLYYSRPSPEARLRTPDRKLDWRHVQTLDLGDNAASEVLSYDQGEWYKIAEPQSGKAIELFWLQYNRDTPYFTDLGHPPEACMASIGNELVADYPWREIPNPAGTPMVFRALEFQSKSRPSDSIYLFKSRWIGGFGSIGETPLRTLRLQFLLRGQRPGPALIALGGVTGCESEAEAWALFSAQVFRN